MSTFIIPHEDEKRLNAARFWLKKTKKLNVKYADFVAFLRHIDNATRREDGSYTFLAFQVRCLAQCVFLDRVKGKPDLKYFSDHELDLMEDYIEKLKEEICL